MKHQLAAILYADVVGYTKLTGIDEEAPINDLTLVSICLRIL